MQFWKTHIFPNSNKIAIKTPNKISFDFNIKSPIFLYFEEVILSLSFIFTKEIFEEKIIKIKRSSLQNLRKLKYVNNEIPNSLRGSLSCLGFSRIKTKRKIKYDMHDDLMYNIPN